MIDTNITVVGYAITKSLLSEVSDPLGIVIYREANNTFQAKVGLVHGVLPEVDVNLAMEHGVNMPYQSALKWLNTLKETVKLDGYPTDKSDVVVETPGEEDRFAEAKAHFKKLTAEARDNYVTQFLQQYAGVAPTDAAYMPPEQLEEKLPDFYVWLNDLLFAIVVVPEGVFTDAFDEYDFEFPPRQELTEADEKAGKVQGDIILPPVETAVVKRLVFHSEEAKEAFELGMKWAKRNYAIVAEPKGGQLYRMLNPENEEKDA